MPLPVPKKRKLSHSPTDDEDDIWSGFSPEPNEGEQEGTSCGDDENESNEDAETSSGINVDGYALDGFSERDAPPEILEDDNDSADEHISEDVDKDNENTTAEDIEQLGTVQGKATDSIGHADIRPRHTVRHVGDRSNSMSRKVEKRAIRTLHLAGNPGSNVLKLQIEELLDQIRPSHGKTEATAESTLKSLKGIIENIPNSDSLPILQAEEELMKFNKVRVPFPDPRPGRDTQYKLQYAKPAAINVVGSYALKIESALDHTVIDLVVLMPSLLFQDKDYLDFRYFYRRAYYLASLAAGIRKADDGNLSLRFQHLHGNTLLPVLIAKPRTEHGAQQRFGANYVIRIIPSAPDTLFAISRTMPNKKCIRGDNDSTPFYNASLRLDAAILPYLKLIHSASVKSDFFKDACLLGRTWLRQRGFGSSIATGGFGNFEWAALMAILLQDDLPRGITKFSHGFDSFQLFRATLQFLASRDLTKQPIWYQCSDGAMPTRSTCPMFLDGLRGMNILYKMDSSSYKAFRYEARTTIKMFGDSKENPFEAAFILKNDIPALRYDAVLELRPGPSDLDQVYSIMSRSLGDRVSLIKVGVSSQADQLPAWILEDIPRRTNEDSGTQIGLVFNPINVNRLIDHGPLAEDPEGSARFRQFWGDKAELRRFKDGSVRESLVWSSKGNVSITEQIVRHVLTRHMGVEVAESTIYHGTELARKVPGGEQQTTTAFKGIMTAFETLSNDIRGLDSLPLAIRQITATDSQLRYSSIDPPLYGSTKQMTSPASVIIQFEGSGRWPDDLEAIQRVKIAFLLKLSSLLTTSHPSIIARLGLENSQQPYTNCAFLDITYPTGHSFRLRIHHDREHHLLSTRLHSPSSSSLLPSKTKESLAYALASHKRAFLALPAHTTALQTACFRFPALSPTIRLLHLWLASHLLTPHFPSPLIDLLAARAFTAPWPWDVPSSAAMGFQRTLFFLARWDWRAEPWVVEFSAAEEVEAQEGERGGQGSSRRGGGMTAEDRRQIAVRFEAWRKVDPAMNRVAAFVASDVNREGTEWTEWRPRKVVLGRMVGLARAAMEVVEREGYRLDPERLFVRALGEYDFVVRIKKEFTRAGRRNRESSNGGEFKNLRLQRKVEPEKVGFDPVGAFLLELEEVYGDAVVFFYDGYREDVIAGLWDPHTAKRKWKVHLDYSSLPLHRDGDDVGDVEINKDSILGDIARLGGNMIEKIEMN